MIVWGGIDVNCGSLEHRREILRATQPRSRSTRSVHRQGGERFVALTWSPADGGSVNVLRNGVVVDTTDDDGAAQDKLGTHTGTFFYQVCETDSGECSNQVRVVVQETGD